MHAVSASCGHACCAVGVHAVSAPWREASLDIILLQDLCEELGEPTHDDGLASLVDKQCGCALQQGGTTKRICMRMQAELSCCLTAAVGLLDYCCCWTAHCCTAAVLTCAARMGCMNLACTSASRKRLAGRVKLKVLGLLLHTGQQGCNDLSFEPFQLL